MSSHKNTPIFSICENRGIFRPSIFNDIARFLSVLLVAAATTGTSCLRNKFIDKRLAETYQYKGWTPPLGIEPRTAGLAVLHSIRLSYGGTKLTRIARAGGQGPPCLWQKEVDIRVASRVQTARIDPEESAAWRRPFWVLGWDMF